MKFSKLFKELYDTSNDVNRIVDLAECTDVPKSFIERGFAGTNSFEKIDKVFDYLTSDFEVEDFMAALDLIQSIRENERRREIDRTSLKIVVADYKHLSEAERLKMINEKMEEAKQK